MIGPALDWSRVWYMRPSGSAMILWLRNPVNHTRSASARSRPEAVASRCSASVGSTPSGSSTPEAV